MNKRNVPLALRFNDFAQAIHRIEHVKILKSLYERGLAKRCLRIFLQLQSRQFTFKKKNKKNCAIKTITSVLQGCSVWRVLCNAHADEAVKNFQTC